MGRLERLGGFKEETREGPSEEGPLEHGWNEGRGHTNDKKLLLVTGAMTSKEGHMLEGNLGTVVFTPMCTPHYCTLAITESLMHLLFT